MATKESPRLEARLVCCGSSPAAPARAERCELCSLEICAPTIRTVRSDGPQAGVLVRCLRVVVQRTQLMPGSSGCRDEIRLLSEFHMTDAQWDGLMVPINMAFFFRSSPEQGWWRHVPQSGGRHGVAAFAGGVERNCATRIPNSKKMEPDVEALLVNRIGHARGFTARGVLHLCLSTVLQAGRPDSQPVARLLRRHGGVAADCAGSSVSCEPAPW